MKKETLSYIELKAAALVALGETEAEISLQTSLSKQQLNTLKRHEEFKKVVEETRTKIKKSLLDDIDDSVASDINEFRKDFRLAASKLYYAGNVLINKCILAAENIDELDLTPKTLANLLKAASDALSTSLDIRKAALGLDELLEYTDEFKQITEASQQSTGEGKSFTSEIEEN